MVGSVAVDVNFGAPLLPYFSNIICSGIDVDRVAPNIDHVFDLKTLLY